MSHSAVDPAFHELRPWNDVRVMGAKRALKAHQVWAIRFWLDQHRRLRDRALFDFAIDSKLRGCDVATVRISDIVAGGNPDLAPCLVALVTRLGELHIGIGGEGEELLLAMRRNFIRQDLSPVVAT